MASKAPFIFGGVFGGCALIVIIILISVSFSKIEMTEVGLLYSHASRRIDREKLYTAGRYYVGVGGEFITFPITQQEMHLPIFESRTRDGLLVSLDVSLNYKVDKDFEKILAIFDHFGHHYDGFLSRLAMNIIRDASAKFSAYEYSMNRSVVNTEMDREITDDMSALGFTLDSVQLLNVEFPAAFSQSLQDTRMAQQAVTQAEMNKTATKVQLEGQLANADERAKGIRVKAQSEALGISQDAQAEAQSINITLFNEGQSHKLMIDMFYELSTIDDTTPEGEKQRTEEAHNNFVNWYWMNQVTGSKAGKNVAVSVPDGLM